MSLDAEEVAYRARALAQAHPLTPMAKRYIDRVVADQRTSQPLPEIGIWAGAAILNGYCVRRVEEGEAGLCLEVSAAEGDSAGAQNEAVLDRLEEAASRRAAMLRLGQPGPHVLGDEERTVQTLDRIVASEVERRLDHWRDDIDDKAWDELGEYITWWVVKGYALRAAEMVDCGVDTGPGAAASPQEGAP